MRYGEEAAAGLKEPRRNRSKGRRDTPPYGMPPTDNGQRMSIQSMGNRSPISYTCDFSNEQGGIAPKASPEHSDVDPIASPRWPPNQYHLKVSG